LLEREPRPAIVSVAHGRHPALPLVTGQVAELFEGSWTIELRRSRDLSGECTTMRRGTPTTNPLRSLVDLAGDGSPRLLDEAIDVALARKLVTVNALMAEATRLKKPGRRGPAQLMTTLTRRGFAGAPTPSVLESRALRLLKAAGIKVSRCETVVDGGRYRLDIQLGPRLFLEVDGYAYHWSAEHKRHDDVRRNRLRICGQEILVYDWTMVMRHGNRLLSEVKLAIAKTGPGSQASPAGAAPRTALA
jgi:very-short-patch-repair endonuclease